MRGFLAVEPQLKESGSCKYMQHINMLHVCLYKTSTRARVELCCAECQEMVNCIFPTDEVSSSNWSPCVKPGFKINLNLD